MEQNELFVREIFKELQPRVNYTLTELGEKLVKILWELNDWGK